ncbi:MAG: urea transport system permease protein [Oleiphilaceae bacterium]|jgi:urea transport system permease protein
MAQASEESISKTSIPELLTKLTKVKLNKSIPVLIELEEQVGEEMLPLFKTMLKGELYYLKKTKELVAVSKVEGEKVYADVFTGERLATMKKSSVKKVRVNNKVRRFLRETIARTQLTAADPEARYKALNSLLSELDAGTVKTIQTLKVHETDADVLELMDVAVAMFTITDSKDAKERLAAVHIISGRLEPEVRNLFVAVVNEEQDLKVKGASEKALASIEQRIEKFQFVDKIFFGLSLGSVLLLAAIGLAITFGVMGVINMAHGEMIMLGAYTTYVVQLMMPNAIDYSLWVAIPLAFIVSGSVGVLIERGVIRHLHGRPLETLLATFGISLILQQLVRTVFSPLNRQVQAPSWMSGSLDINPVLSLTMNRLYILAFALLVFGLLLLILNKTSLGLNVRAVSQNRNMAKAMGIKTDRVDAITFGLGSGIAGMAGVALSQLTNVGPNLGQAYIIDSFMVVVFGGVGNLWGTLVAGFSLGIANKFIEPITGAVLASIIVLVFIILFIQKRPKGLFPQKGRAAE